MNESFAEQWSTARAVPSSSSPLPVSADVVSAFLAGAADEEADAILDIARHLAENHQRQWSAEDRCRAAGVSIAEIGEAKRSIDQLNARRVFLVEGIDELVGQSICGPEDAPLHTETVGSVIDRLAIAWVRANHLSQRSESRDHARAALRQLNELATAYDDLVRDLAHGKRRLPTWRTLKSYGSSS